MYLIYITRILNKNALHDIFLLLNIKPYVITKDAKGNFSLQSGGLTADLSHIY